MLCHRDWDDPNSIWRQDHQGKCNEGLTNGQFPDVVPGVGAGDAHGANGVCGGPSVLGQSVVAPPPRCTVQSMR